MTQREEFERVFLHSGLADRDKHLCKAFWNKGFLSGVEAAKAQAVTQWIPVSERLPCDNQPVDVYATIVGGYNNGDKSRIQNCFYDEAVNRFWHWNKRCIRRVYFSGFDVTHWMPLPAPPEQNK